MSSVQKTESFSDEYIAVLRLANYFTVIHVKGTKKEFISELPVEDIKIAEFAAKLFAQQKNIHFHQDLLDLTQPIITICKEGSTWYPAEIRPDRVRLLTRLGTIFLGGSQEDAKHMAETIAMSRNADFIPSIGISMNTDKQ